ncbi:MAG: hypothetical protein ABI462_04640 [Ignavibacteria bacterium]
MKTLKLIPAILILFVAVLAGCSDDITSSGDNSLSTYNKGHKPEVDKLTQVPLYHAQIRLKPHRSQTFNYYNTGLVKFNSINFKNLAPIQTAEVANDCRDMKVSSKTPDNKKGYTEYDCKSSGLDLREITVENTSSTFMDLDVIISGERRAVIPALE